MSSSSPRPGRGVLLLCSDGLWNYRPEAAELAAMAMPAALTRPLDAAADLAKFALDSGGLDNITVVIIPFPPRPDAVPASRAGNFPDRRQPGSPATTAPPRRSPPRNGHRTTRARSKNPFGRMSLSISQAPARPLLPSPLTHVNVIFSVRLRRLPESGKVATI